MPPQPRRRLSPAARREQLLDVAVALAAGSDVSRLSVAEIAAAAGVSEGLLYHYFPTKDALVLAAVQRAADALMAALDVVSAGPSRLALGEGLSAYLDHVQADPTGWRAVLMAQGGELALLAERVMEHGRSLLLAGLGIDVPSAVLQTALDGWTAFERDACLTWLERPEVPRAALEDLLMSSFLAALDAAGRHDEQTRELLERLRGP